MIEVGVFSQNDGGELGFTRESGQAAIEKLIWNLLSYVVFGRVVGKNCRGEPVLPFAVVGRNEFGNGVFHIVHHFLHSTIGVMAAGCGQMVVNVEIVHELTK